jgi:ATP-dependent DNA ligase
MSIGMEQKFRSAEIVPKAHQFDVREPSYTPVLLNVAAISQLSRRWSLTDDRRQTFDDPPPTPPHSLRRVPMASLQPPIAPMEALSVSEVPGGPTWVYEPKWDGFRCIIFRHGENVFLQSKSGKPLDRYFPEVVAAVKRLPEKQFVVDGELAVPVGGALSFDDLLQRIHPAQSRVKALAERTPAIVIVFDLLAVEGESLMERPLRERRAALAAFAKRALSKEKMFRLSPQTMSVSTAKKWLRRTGADLDGVIAKKTDLPYRTDLRDGMQKIKASRSADCVVGGFRYNEGTKIVGSLLLGLYDDEGRLNHVGFTSSIARSDKKDLTQKLERLVGGAGFTGNAPGGPSRWSTKRSAEWKPLRPRLVVEVRYDHFTGGRFRHGTQLLRWRPDKAPKQCRMDQVRQKRVTRISIFGGHPS